MRTRTDEALCGAAGESVLTVWLLAQREEQAWSVWPQQQQQLGPLFILLVGLFSLDLGWTCRAESDQMFYHCIWVHVFPPVSSTGCSSVNHRERKRSDWKSQRVWKWMSARRKQKKGMSSHFARESWKSFRQKKKIWVQLQPVGWAQNAEWRLQKPVIRPQWVNTAMIQSTEWCLTVFTVDELKTILSLKRV